MNLIYDRTQTDINNALSIRRKYQALGDWSGITEEETAQLKRGTYTCFDDMNRVDAAVRDIGAHLTAAGYPVRYTSPVPQPETPEKDYTELLYIESSGTQYIDTGYKPNNNTKVVLKASIISPNPDYTAVFGARTGETNQFWVYYSTRDAKWGVRYGSQMAYIDGTYTGDKNINCNRNIFSVDSASHTFSAQTYQTPYTMYLFAANDNGRLHLPGAIRYYWCEIYDNDVLVRDYIPAIQNGRAGLYDKVESKMYYSNGTDDFIAGEAIIKPDDTYEELGYIESTGTQYIDTRYIPNSNTRVICNVSNIKSTSEFPCVFGSRRKSTSNLFNLFVLSDTKVRTDYGTEALNFETSVNITENLRIDKNKNICKINNKSIENAQASFVGERTLFLFACHSNLVPTNFAKSMRMTSCQIYDNGILVRDYIPAKQNGKIGLYDKANKKFYPNIGTGEFLYGEKPLFNIGDIINYDIWRTYIDNVQALRDAYYVMKDTPDLPEPTAPLKFDGANAIEKLIFDVQVLYNAMSASYRKCGTFQAGTNTQRLPLQRSVT